MSRQALLTKPVIILILIIQIIPLIIFPAKIYKVTNQDWWLPLMLVVMVLVGVFQILFGRKEVMWPWYLISFAQGFNIISRLMMIFPHATINSAGKQIFNAPYVYISIAAMLLSTLFIYVLELPESRMVMQRE